MKRYMLVYQAGIANIFLVKSFSLTDKHRAMRRVYQGDFRTAEAMARGLGEAGAVVRSAGCNRAGDISEAPWESDFGPFRDQCRPVSIGSEGRA